MAMKSERLRKLEMELQDLDQWLKLGLVPRKDIERHNNEIHALHEKIQEEKARLRFLKESGALEEYVPPKRNAHARQPFAEAASMPGVEVASEGLTDFGLDENEAYDFDTSSGGESESGADTASGAEEESEDEKEDEDPFSDRNRWKRGVLEDPDADNW